MRSTGFKQVELALSLKECVGLVLTEERRRHMSGGRPREAGTMAEMSCRRSDRTGANAHVGGGGLRKGARKVHVLSLFMSRIPFILSSHSIECVPGYGISG